MKKPITTRVLIALAAPLLLFTTPAAATAQADDPRPEDGFQTPEEALRDDLANTAASHGWTIAQAEDQYRVTEAVDAIASTIAPERLETFVGTALSEEPGGTPTLYIKGEADEFIRDVIRESGQDVIVADRQAFSYLELQGRNERLTRELIALGYADLSSGVDITDGTITAHLAAQPGLPSDPGEIRERLSEEFRRGVVLTVAEDLGNTAQHGYGGLPLFDGKVPECTSGWTVTTPQGVTGVSAAGHCTGIDEAWGSGEGYFDLDKQTEHRGYLGDVEWHTTPSHTDAAEFYSHPTVRRDVLSVEPWWEITVGETICVFGRATNERNCDSDVEEVVWSCTLQGYLTQGLVRMNAEVTDGGDSGAGWSFNTQAYGSHVGLCWGTSVFTRADLFSEALGVSVLLK
ncbi:hypothetical protein [Glycomyces harbinensis]|uniref:Streptogrisin C n=1 Tax=Glycomyces harbinensis TaxID=58114 RepID=A0A1G6TVF8_9ACTN|nr:hypothetical protein [Glycomyces harbinensis]SDD32295.1 hypothetical protein SAMN05216270_103140 [Glycomyces harbinensis]